MSKLTFRPLKGVKDEVFIANRKVLSALICGGGVLEEIPESYFKVTEIDCTIVE